MNTPNLDQVTRTPFVSTKDGVITREAYYFLLALVNFVEGNPDFSLKDLSILEAFDSNVGGAQSVTAKLDEIQGIVASLPDSVSQVGELKKLVSDVQALLATVEELGAQVGETGKALQDARILLSTIREVIPDPSSAIVSLGLIRGAGVPTDGVTGAGVASPGLVDYFDTTANDRYMNAGTLAAPVWKLWTRSP